ncbi:hypothetical protein Mterra_03480 [Calidithermus terrae]|uniref:Uncharacterized protein n=1 Tax=Calidithermus terrae TaxID=1408545 RepID=A0A399E9T2_9DEIN|nr:hypothetical protein [Calidithermus terrae]RIH80698.1 hypothetical protein Mterra_03480 [Calidithermus terrae]
MRHRGLVVCIGITVGIALAVGALTVSRRPPTGRTPLFGTAGSLRGTDFCRKYGCEYEGAEKFAGWVDQVFHFFRLLRDSAERPFDQKYLPGTAKVMLRKDLEGRIVQAELILVNENNPKGFETSNDPNIIRDFMLLMVGNLGDFHNAPTAVFSRLCGTDIDGRYMGKFMLTKGELAKGSSYFVYCLSLMKPDSTHTFNNSIVWTVSMTDEEYRRR